MSRSWRELARGEAGMAASEFALILPILSLLMFGFFEAGRMYWNYNIIQSSARDAARYAARMPIACDSAGNSTIDATDVTEIKNLTRTGNIAGTGDPVVPGWTDNASVTVTVTCINNTSGTYTGRYDGQTMIPAVSVTATAPHGAMFGGLLGFGLDTITVANAQAWTE